MMFLKQNQSKTIMKKAEVEQYQAWNDFYLFSLGPEKIANPKLEFQKFCSI